MTDYPCSANGTSHTRRNFVALPSVATWIVPICPYQECSGSHRPDYPCPANGTSHTRRNFVALPSVATWIVPIWPYQECSGSHRPAETEVPTVPNRLMEKYMKKFELGRERILERKAEFDIVDADLTDSDLADSDLAEIVKRLNAILPNSMPEEEMREHVQGLNVGDNIWDSFEEFLCLYAKSLYGRRDLLTNPGKTDDNSSNFHIGQLVEMRNNGEDWNEGYVSSTSPLMVGGHGVGWDSRSWDEVRPISCGVAVKQDGHDLKLEEACDQAASDDWSGWYRITNCTAVTSGILTSSTTIGSVQAGTLVHVLAVERCAQQTSLSPVVRAKIEEPSGWISLENTQNGIRWAKKENAPVLVSNHYAGDMMLRVANTSDLGIPSESTLVTIDIGTSVEEKHRVIGNETGVLSLEFPLRFNHARGSLIRAAPEPVPLFVFEEMDAMLSELPGASRAPRVPIGRFGTGSATYISRDDFLLCSCLGRDVLIEHEIRFALQACGVCLSGAELHKRLGNPAVTDFQTFCELISQLNVEECHQVRAVPFAKRGLSLHQLRELHSVFIESGWLQRICDSYNAENRVQIESNTKYKKAPNLYAITEYIIKPVTAADNLEYTCVSSSPTVEMKRAAGIPQTTIAKSYAQLVNSDGLISDFFVSHWWGHPFTLTMNALTSVAHGACKQPCTSPDTAVFWICAFALNQHQAEEEVGTSPETGPFNAALKHAKFGVVMILDANVEPFRRIWCLYEVARTHACGKDFQLVSDRGSLMDVLDESQAVTERSRNMQYVEAIAEALADVSAMRANSSYAQDQLAIWWRIADPWVASQFKTFQYFQEVMAARRNGDAVKGVRETTVEPFLSFDSKVRGLLSTPLLGLCFTTGDGPGALKHIARGAHFTVAQTEHLEVLIGSLSSVELAIHGIGGTCTLLHCVARFGHVSVIDVLLHRSVEIDAAVRDGESVYDGATALHLGAASGHEAVVLRLLVLRAHVEAKKTNACAALHDAVTFGHIKIADTLLEFRAHVDVRGRDSFTPLHFAAQDGQREAADLLTHQRACINAEERESGCIPLHVAAMKGHLELVDTLLCSRSDIHAQNKNQASALHLSAWKGKVHVVNSLLCYRANVHQLDQHLDTPLHYATVRGHAAVVHSLLEYRSDANAANSSFLTPLYISVQDGNREIAAILGMNALQYHLFRLSHTVAKSCSTCSAHCASCGVAAGIDAGGSSDLQKLHALVASDERLNTGNCQQQRSFAHEAHTSTNNSGAVTGQVLTVNNAIRDRDISAIMDTKDADCISEVQSVASKSSLQSSVGSYSPTDADEKKRVLPVKIQALMKAFTKSMVKGREMNVLSVDGQLRHCKCSFDRKLLKFNIIVQREMRTINLSDISEVLQGIEPEDIATPLDDFCCTLVLINGECLSFRFQELKEREEFAMCLQIIVDGSHSD